MSAPAAECLWTLWAVLFLNKVHPYWEDLLMVLPFLVSTCCHPVALEPGTVFHEKRLDLFLE